MIGTKTNDRLVAVIDDYLFWVYGRRIRQDNGRWVLGDVYDSDKQGKSLVVYPDGHWKDFGSPASGRDKGDLVGLYAELSGNLYDEACRVIDKDFLLNYSEAEIESRRAQVTDTIKSTSKWQPADPEAHPWDTSPPDHIFRYRMIDGPICLLVGRWEVGSKRSGVTLDKKVFAQAHWGVVGTNSAPQWVHSRPKIDLPIYHLDQLAVNHGKTVVIVEGEKKCDQAQAALLQFVFTTWCGGANGIEATDFLPLKGRKVILWPDNDEAGIKCMDKLGAKLKAVGCDEVLFVTPPGDEFPPGWDIGDALMENGPKWAWTKIKSAQKLFSSPVSQSETLSDEEVEPKEMNQLGNVYRFLDKYGHEVRWNTNARQWMIWDGRRWSFDRGSFVWSRIVSTVESIISEIPVVGGKEMAKLRTFINGSKSTHHMTGIEVGARQMPGVAISEEQMDTLPMKLNLKNGTLDLETMKLEPHNSKELHSKLANVEYLPEAEAPKFLRFVQEITGGRPDIIRFLRAYFGYALTGLPPDRVFSIFYGSGRNGKSTITGIVAEILGDYHVTARVGSFLQASDKDKPDRIGEDMIPLRGARMISLQEGDRGARLQEGKIKEMTGRDKVKCRYLHSNLWVEFISTGKIIMSTNYKPRVLGSDSGIWDRIKLIPFDVRISDDQVDPDLADKILAHERSGVLNWMIEGLKDFIACGKKLPDSEAIKQETAEYRDDENILGKFVEDVFDYTEKSATIQAGKVYDAYTKWMGQQSETAVMGSRNFGECIRPYFLEKGVAKKRHSSGNVYTGVKFKIEYSTSDEPY